MSPYGDVTVTLTWGGRNDLNLHVIDPGGFDIYEGQVFSYLSGGGWTGGDGSETVSWRPGMAPPGTYTVLVSYYRHCPEDPLETDYTVQVEVDGVPMLYHGKFTSVDGCGDTCGLCAANNPCTPVYGFTR